MIETFAAGMDAMRRHAWDEAFHAFTQVDRETGLAPQ
jgi:hypothetical protein